MDGEALYKEVERVFPYLANKFLFVGPTAASRGGLGDFVYQTGNALLEKPFEMDAFRAAIAELFNR